MVDMSNGWTIRAALPADEAALRSLLAQPGQERALVPSADGEQLLVAVSVAHGAASAAAVMMLGCVRVRRGVGLDRPRYWYHVGCAVHAAPALDLYHRQRTLLLGNDLTGAWEIADLACDTAALDHAGQAALLRQLLAAALRLIADRRAAAPVATNDAGEDARVICELPGLQDDAGRSPFWDSLGRHFYDGDPRLAAERCGPQWKTHVAALLPREPLLVSFLSVPAQQALGRAAARAAIQAGVLHAAGLRAGQHVTIDDAGPVFEGEIDLVRA
jgi:arginine N-succinyltransferase